MGFTGKYDFPGIKKLGVSGLRIALASSPYTAWVLKGGKLTDAILGAGITWLANKGLVILNTGAFYVNGELDQKALDKAIDNGIKRVQAGGLTPQQMKEIDDAVIEAADRALPYGNGPRS